MKKEIGSEFWEVPIREENNFFSKETIWFSSGGSALRAIIKDIRKTRKIKTVAMPSWCCESMIKPFLNANVKVIFYPVYFENKKLHQKVNYDEDIIFVMDYFGYNQEIDLKNTDKIIIRDLTHSVFSKQYIDADYYFGSLRKWCGFYTGGFAYKKQNWNIELDFFCVNKKYILLRKKAMQEKKEYINNKRNDKNYLHYFNSAEDYLDNVSKIEKAYEGDIEKIKKLDIDYIKKQRYKNAKYLLENIRFNKTIYPIFTHIKKNDTPLFFPIIIKNRDELRKLLIKNNIYCPVHWGKSEYHKLDKKTRYLYEHGLSIVCDQRYDIDDMKKICKIINEWRNLDV